MKHLYFASCSEQGGIYHYVLSGEKLSFKEKLSLDRPMYMVIEGKKAYIILRETDCERHFGGLVTCDIDSDGKLVNLTDAGSTNGIVPCHLAVDNGQVWTVNYLSGNIVKMPATTVTHKGKGVDPVRQDAPHTHFVTVAPDGYLLCCDLGLDTIFTYDKDLNEVSTAKVPDGMGCRHLEFSEDGKTVWCVNEMGNTVSIFDYCGGRLTLRETVDALPDFNGKNTAAAIRRGGKYLYVSHRGADSVARFEILPDNGLKLLETTPVGGASPRDILIVYGLLFCANELTDNVTVFKLSDGRPVKQHDELLMSHPLCICAVDI